MVLGEKHGTNYLPYTYLKILSVSICSGYAVWDTLCQTQPSRGCQVIATKNMRLFCQENGLKPHISV